MTTKKMMTWAFAAMAVALLGLGSTAQAAAKKAAPTETTQTASDGEGVVNLNSATEEELMLLPGVGPSKAERIVAYRTKYGNFKKVDDLVKVKGFGRKTLKKLKPYLTVSGATTFKGAKKTKGGGDQGAAAAQDER